MAYLGQDIGKLGFGLMRLPKLNDKTDIEQSKKMVDLFMQNGFTYFDTAWAYGDSEKVTKEILVDRYPRESFQLATKVSAWVDCKTREDAVKQFGESLENTGAGYFDYYLLHNLGEERTALYEQFGLWEWAQELKEKGLIKHLGFSFHSTPEELDEILTKHPETEFVQLQINYADWDSPAIRSRECYDVARKHNKPIIIMEPVRGGELATPPESVQQVFKEAEPTMSVASWAVRFAADLDGVITVLSGMSSIEQVQDNLSFMTEFKALTEGERETIKTAQQKLAEIPTIPCTSCNYCAKVCPMNIGISGTFTARNKLTLYGNEERAMSSLVWNVDKHDKKRSSYCIKCGACERVCPQHIAIIDELKKSAEMNF